MVHGFQLFSAKPIRAEETVLAQRYCWRQGEFDKAVCPRTQHGAYLIVVGLPVRGGFYADYSLLRSTSFSYGNFPLSKEESGPCGLVLLPSKSGFPLSSTPFPAFFGASRRPFCTESARTKSAGSKDNSVCNPPFVCYLGGGKPLAGFGGYATWGPGMICRGVSGCTICSRRPFSSDRKGEYGTNYHLHRLA